MGLKKSLKPIFKWEILNPMGTHVANFKLIKGVLSGIQGDNWFETFVNSHLFF